MKKLAIGSGAFLFNQEPPTNDFHTLVHKLGHLGYQGIELLGLAPHPNPDSHDTLEKRQKLRKMVADHRMELAAYAPVLRREKLWSVEDPTPYLNLFEKNLIFAQDLGITTVRLDTNESIASQESRVAPQMLFDRCVKAYDACAKLAAPRGITIAWEFEPCFALNKPGEIIALVDAVRSRGNANFGVLYDTGHAHMCAAVGANQIGPKETLPGGGLELLQKLKGKIAHLHLIDSDGSLNAENTSTRTPLGQGILNFDLLIPEMLASGVSDDWWTVDLCYWPDAWNVAADSKRFLDKLRHRYNA